MQNCLEPLGQHCVGFFFLCNVIPIVLRQHCTGFFIAESYLECLGFQLCNAVPRLLRQYSTEFLLMQCCLEPFGQHCIVFLTVQ